LHSVDKLRSFAKLVCLLDAGSPVLSCTVTSPPVRHGRAQRLPRHDAVLRAAIAQWSPTVTCRIRFSALDHDDAFSCSGYRLCATQRKVNAHRALAVPCQHARRAFITGNCHQYRRSQLTIFTASDDRSLDGCLNSVLTWCNARVKPGFFSCLVHDPEHQDNCGTASD
jgi:hypothetical protein